MKMLAIVTDESGKVLGKADKNNTYDAVQWAMDTYSSCAFDLFLFSSHDDKPIRRYGFRSLWCLAQGELQNDKTHF